MNIPCRAVDVWLELSTFLSSVWLRKQIFLLFSSARSPLAVHSPRAKTTIFFFYYPPIIIVSTNKLTEYLRSNPMKSSGRDNDASCAALWRKCQEDARHLAGSDVGDTRHSRLLVFHSTFLMLNAFCPQPSSACPHPSFPSSARHWSLTVAHCSLHWCAFVCIRASECETGFSRGTCDCSSLERGCYRRRCETE